eukprot:6206099-Pleurochrysis_carterae.AAC.1
MVLRFMETDTKDADRCLAATSLAGQDETTNFLGIFVSFTITVHFSLALTTRSTTSDILITASIHSELIEPLGV